MTTTNGSSTSTLPLSTSDLKQEVQIRKGESGWAAIEPQTVLQMFDATVQRCGDLPALHVKKIPTVGGTVSTSNIPWTTWTWKEYRARVDDFAKALLSIGFAKFDAINICGFNDPSWFVAHFGCIVAGGVSAGIYTTNNPDACYYVTHHSNAKVVVVEGMKQLEKYYDISSKLPSLKAVVVYGIETLPSDVKTKCTVPVYTFDDFCVLGTNNVSDADVQTSASSWKCGETCSLIYTSGTTGPPKAVMLTHDNITWTCRTMLTATPKGTMDETDAIISYLPLSHIAAQQLDMYMPAFTGCQVFFAMPDALKGTLAITLKEVRPTVFFGVPRVWEKFYDKLQEVGRKSTGIKKILSTWAKSQALEYWEGQQMGNEPSHPFFLFLARKLLHKAHEALGLDRCCNGFYVAAAPIEVKVLKYFASLDIPIMEIFGQSECTGPHTVNKLTAFQFGSCGRPLLGTQTKVDPTTGELCYSGRHIFAGYFGMPDKTAESIDPDGWLHSGDVVRIDDHHDPEIPPPSGFVYITGRIKELIITAGGENVPPVLIEEQLKAAMPALSNVMVIGDKRKFLTVLLCLQVEIDAEGVASNKLTGVAVEVGKQIGSTATTTDEARDDPRWKEYFDNGIKSANAKATSNAQKVGKWALLDTDFTEKCGELTPTLKLKRSVTAEKYQDVIEKMYA